MKKNSILLGICLILSQSLTCAQEDEPVEFVLDRPAEEKPLLDEAAGRARDAVFCWVEFGIEAAMNRFNVAKEKEAQSGGN